MRRRWTTYVGTVEKLDRQLARGVITRDEHAVARMLARVDFIAGQ